MPRWLVEMSLHRSHQTVFINKMSQGKITVFGQNVDKHRNVIDLGSTIVIGLVFVPLFTIFNFSCHFCPPTIKYSVTWVG